MYAYYIISSFLILGYVSADINNMTRSFKGYWCDYNNDCFNLIGLRSFCLANECQCVPHYHINYKSNCVRDRGLREPCEFDDECYWGPEMVNKIECNLGVCECTYGYIPGPGKICVRYFDEYEYYSQSNGSLLTIQLMTILSILSIGAGLSSILL